MAMYELAGKEISIQVSSLGAELKSLKDNATGQEYMWRADPEYWGKTSPILFPFVGRLKNQSYTYEGRVYKQKPHGFARDMVFELCNRTSDTLWLGIQDTQETKEGYPFSFSFQIGYEIVGKSLRVLYRIENRDTCEMFFSVGAHPAFACPLREGEKRADYFLKFGNLDNILSNGVDMSTGLATHSYQEYVLEQGILPIDDYLFEQDALILEGHQVNEVSLLLPDKTPYITLRMDAPVYGIWSCVKPGAPYVCIEPWFGRCDDVDFRGELQDREWQQKLEAGKVFETMYEIFL